MRYVNKELLILETYMNHTYEVKVVEGKFDFYLFFNQVERFGRNLSLSLKEPESVKLTD